MRTQRRRVTQVLSVVLVLLFLFVGPARAETVRELGRITAKAAVIMDNRTGEVLFARNPHLRLPPASTTKIVTALVALESGKLGQNVPVSPYASSMQPSKIWLRPGWVMNMDDLLYATLLNSANDASVALAEGVAGSVPEFSRRMNVTARSLGAKRSNFSNPNGLPAARHYSTAFDLATIMRHGARMPELRRALTTKKRQIRPRRGANRKIALRSHNRFLYRKEVPVIGKTGYTRKAKRCFVGVASDGQKEIVVAMLGSDQLWPDLDRLVDYGMQKASVSGTPAAVAKWQEASASQRAEPERGSVPPRLPEPKRAEKPASTDAWKQAVRELSGRDLATWEAASKRVKKSARSAEARAVEGQFAYHLQLASFRSQARAVDLRRRVGRHGYLATVETSREGPRTVYRVTVRGFATRASARRAARVLGDGLRVEPLILAARI